MLLTLLTYLGVAALDRGTKLLALGALTPGVSAPVTRFLDLTLVFNKGAAFGMFPTFGPALAVLRGAVAVGVLLLAARLQREGRIVLVSLGLVGGGALGNLIDYLAYRHVVDFLDFKFWPVFNVADAAVVVGGIYLAARLILVERNRHEAGAPR